MDGWGKLVAEAVAVLQRRLDPLDEESLAGDAKRVSVRVPADQLKCSLRCLSCCEQEPTLPGSWIEHAPAGLNPYQLCGEGGDPAGAPRLGALPCPHPPAELEQPLERAGHQLPSLESRREQYAAQTLEIARRIVRIAWLA